MLIIFLPITAMCVIAPVPVNRVSKVLSQMASLFFFLGFHLDTDIQRLDPSLLLNIVSKIPAHQMIPFPLATGAKRVCTVVLGELWNL